MSMTDRNTAFAENETHLKMTRPLLPELLRRIEEGRFQTSVTAKRTLSSCPNFVRRLQLQNCLEGHLGGLYEEAKLDSPKVQSTKSIISISFWVFRLCKYSFFLRTIANIWQ